MNVGQIKRKVANLLQKLPSDFVLNTEDMLLMAMNNARLFAEQTHDFEKSKKIAQVTISSPQGVSLGTATEYLVGGSVKVKSIDNCAIVGDDGSLFPIDFRKRSSVMAELRKANRVDSTYFFGRYPPDWAAEGVLCDGIREVMQYNDVIMLRPMLKADSGSIVVAMEAHTWFNDYGPAETYSDFFTDHGFNYLIWQSVVEANHLSKEFVFRQEGNLSPPDKLADKYLQGLINLDLFSVDQNVDVTGD